MSDAALLLYEADDCQFEHILSQLEQQWPAQEQVTRALRQANSAFAAQCTQPDGNTYMQACDNLVAFLNMKVPLEYDQQELVVQALQVACAVHENAVNNPALTPTQRSSHYLATTSLVPLCKSALEGCVTNPDLYREMTSLAHRAQQAHAKATDALDLSKYFDFDNMEGGHFYEPGCSADRAGTAPSPVPATPKAIKSAPSKTTAPRESTHDATADTRLTPRSAKLRDAALAMLNDKPYKAAPLGRCHTMPTLLQTASAPYPSRVATSRTSSKARSRSGRGLRALQEAEE